MSLRFAITGTGGFIAPRHLAAIEAVGGELTAALDPHDSVGRLDAYNVDCESFQDEEAFWEHLSRNPVDYVSICSPNDQHYRQTRRALGVGAHAICEKPLVLDPRELDAYEHLERDGARVWPILQLRLNAQLQALRARVQDDQKQRRVYATYITRRGKWYHRSWKGDPKRSGTILTNLGVHVFDVLTWIWGGNGARTDLLSVKLEQDYAEGELEFTRAYVDWKISSRPEDLEHYTKRRHAHAHRSLLISEGSSDTHLEIDLSDGFEVNHLEVYERIIAGDWIGYKDVRPGIQLIHDMLAAPRVITRHDAA